MAATLAPSVHQLDDSALEAAVANLRNGSVAWTLAAGVLNDRRDMEADIAAERAGERYYEDRGAYYASSEEEARDKFADWLAGR